jgi:hypothetical protein
VLNDSTAWLMRVKPFSAGRVVQVPLVRRAATLVAADPSAVMAMELH